AAMTTSTPKQLLHLVFGGELVSPDTVEFKDLTKLDIVGIFPNFAEARRAWAAKAQGTVDNAQMRYFVVHIHKLMEPDLEDSH
ncbi:MAG TPA: DUF4170 domain-containing protein, partial [Rhizomicrobium sp.]|nr:DUF4170 domain-containing protein [Rhizomicrobium sp.]